MAVFVVACCLVLLVAIGGFFWRFAIIKSISIDRLPNNKEPPKIMAFQANLDDVEERNREESLDPHFGGQPARNSYYDRSLMLESKENSGLDK